MKLTNLSVVDYSPNKGRDSPTTKIWIDITNMFQKYFIIFLHGWKKKKIFSAEKDQEFNVIPVMGQDRDRGLSIRLRVDIPNLTRLRNTFEG